MGLNRRSLLVAAAPLALCACGFQLRKAPDFVFKTIFIGAAATSTLGTELKRSIAGSGAVTVVPQDRAEVVQTALAALQVAGLECRADFHAVLGACLIDRIEHRALFDQAVVLFWGWPGRRGARGRGGSRSAGASSRGSLANRAPRRAARRVPSPQPCAPGSTASSRPG